MVGRSTLRESRYRMADCAVSHTHTHRAGKKLVTHWLEFNTRATSCHDDRVESNRQHETWLHIQLKEGYYIFLGSKEIELRRGKIVCVCTEREGLAAQLFSASSRNNSRDRLRFDPFFFLSPSIAIRKLKIME